ncbi:MAG: T9SS type A sorting domain-containing protein [Bacteroidia bacterium]
METKNYPSKTLLITRLFCAFAFTLFCFNLRAQTTVTIGAGALSGTSANSATGDCGPMYRSSATSNFVYNRHHYLYTAAELATAGIPAGNNITKLGWNKDLAAATNGPCIFQIWIKNSSSTDVGAAGQAWATLISGSTQVYNNSAHTVASPVGYMEVILTTPFLYTGGALEISVNFDISAGTSPWTTAGFSWKKDNATGRTLSYVGSTAPPATLPNLRTVRAQIQITYAPAGGCIVPPTPGTATATPSSGMCAGTNIALSLTGNSSGSGQTYQWQSSATGGGVGFTNLGASQASPVLNIPATSSLFYRCEVTCSGNSQISTEVPVTVNPALPGGTYTINSAVATGGTNFQTFAAAVSALSCGISGPVIFNVDALSGPYTEQITIPVIGGTSAINTVTFNGNGRTLQFTPVTAARHVLKLDGADFITINNLLIKGLATDFDWGVHVMNGADNNTISNCTIDLNANTSTTQSNSAGIVASNSTTSVITVGNNASNLTITGCTIKGAYTGVILYGNTGSINGVNNVISNNIIQDFYSIGIELNNNDGALVQGNNIHRTNRVIVTTFEGIELGTTNKNVLVNANRIHDTHNSATTQSGTAYGVFLSSCDATAGSENRVTNNLIYNFNSATGIQYGLYNVGSDGVFYYHNTVVLDNTASTAGATYAFHQTTLASNIQVRNNLLYVTRGGTGAKNCLRFATTTSTIICNRNILYINAVGGTSGIGFYSTNFITLLNWQGANSSIYDQQSISSNPVFVSPGTGNYTPSSIVVDNAGDSAGVATDILGAIRSVTTPDAGAYEFTISAGVNIGAFALVTPLATGCYSDVQSVVIQVKNYGSAVDFSVDPATVTCNVTGTTTATLTGTLTGVLGVNQTVDVTLTGTFDMSVNGPYTFNAFTTCGSDGDANNDTMASELRTRVAVVAGTVTANLTQLCVSGAPVLTLAGNSGGSVQWQESTTSVTGPWNNVGTGTNTYAPGTITVTTYYRALGICLTDTQTTNVVTVNVNTPSIVSKKDSSRCGPGTVILEATGSSGTTVNWYAAPAGGAPLGTGSPFTTPGISTTTNFYAAASSGGFSTNVGLTSAITATSTGVGTTNFGLVFDALSAFTLNSVKVYPVSATNASGTITIDVVNGSGTIMHTATVNVTGSPSGSVIPQTVNLNFNILPGTNYKLRPGSFTGISSLLFEPSAGAPGGNYGYPFVVAGVVSINTSTLTAPPTNTARNDLYYYFYNWSISTGCESARTLVTATINTPPPINVTSADPGICGGNSTTVSVSSPNPNFSYSWTSIPSGFTATGAGPHLITPAVTTTYSVTAIDTSGGPSNGCSNGGSVTVVAVGALTAGTASSEQSTYCISGTPTLTLTGSAGAIQWQQSTTSISGPWTNIGTGATTYIPPSALTQTTYFQAVVSCQSDSLISNVVTVTVNNPQVLTAKDSVRCGLGTVTLEATANPGSTINWFTNSTGGTSLGSGSPFITPLITTTTTFFVEASVGGGGADSVAIPIASGTTTGVYHHMFLVNSPTGMTLTGFGIKCNNTVGTLTAWDIYYRPDNYQLVPGSNLSSTGWILLASVTNVPSVGATDYTYLTLGLSLAIPPGSTYSFYVAPVGTATHQYATNAAGTTVISNANASIIAGHRGSTLFNCNTTAGMAVVKLKYTLGCAGSRTAVLATVTPAPPLSITAGSTTLCQGTSTTLAVGTGLSDYTDFGWSPATGLSATTGSSVTATPLVTTKYYLGALNSSSGCQNVDSVTIVVNAVNLNLLVDNPLVCGNASAQLNASVGAGTFTYAWTPSTGLSSTSIANPTSSILTPSQTYTVLVTDVSTSCTKSGTVSIYRSDPVLLTSFGDQRCGPGLVSLTASGTPGLINWWSAPTGGTLLNTGSPYTPNVSSTTTYYAAIKDIIPQTPVSTGFAGATIATDPNAAGNMFNVIAIHDVTITGFDIHLNNNGTLAPSNISVYYKAGTYIGFNNNAGAWTLAGSVTGLTSSGNGVATNLPLTLAINIPAGQTYGIYIVVTNLGVSNSLRYLSSANSPAEGAVAASDYNVQVTSGTVSFGPFTGVPAAPINRMWNGNVKYSIGCESARTAVTAIVTTPPPINITGNSSICFGSSTTLNVTSPNDPNNKYTWNPGGFTGSSITVSPASNTTYTVSVIDTTSGGPNSGCSNIGTFAVTVKSLPSITNIQASPNSICGGAALVTLTALTGSATPGFGNIGTQTTTISGNTGNPYRSGNVIGNEIHTQLLVLASELTAAGLTGGNITSLGFTTTTAAGTVINFSIEMGHTGLSVLTTSYVTTPMTTVFTQASFAAVVGLNTHTFSTPFAWDGVSNVIVDVCQTNSVLGTTTVAAYTPGYSSNLANAIVGGCSAATGTLVTTKPIMRFGGLVGGGAGAGTYNWQWGPGPLPPGNIVTTTPLVNTTYTVTATDPATGCTNSSSISVIVTPTPKPYIVEGDTILCSNDPGFYIHVKDSGTYSGGYPGGTTFEFVGLTVPSNTDDSTFISSSTITAVIVTLPAFMGGCTTTTDLRTIDFGSVQAAQVALTTDSVKCFGEASGNAIANIVFGGTGNYHWKWYDSGYNNVLRDVTTSSPTDSLKGVPQGMYIVVLTDHQGTTQGPYCSVTDSVYVGQPDAPLASNENTLNHVNVLCNGALTGAIDINVTGGTPSYSYNWSNGTSSQDLTATGAGTYTCIITDSRGCTATISVTITQLTAIVINCSSTNAICFNANNGTVSVSASGGTPGYSYLWSNGITVASQGSLAPGTYTVIVTDANGCTKTCSSTVTQPALLVPVISGSTAICAGSSKILNAGAGYTAYNWSTGATTQTISVSTAGTFSVTVTNASGCTGSASVTTVVNPLPTPSITGASTVCTVSTTVISANAGYNAYNWSNGATTQSATVGGGTYTVIVTNANGCTGTASKTITVTASVPAQPGIITGQKIVCKNSNETYSIAAVPGATSYTWTATSGATVNTGQGSTTAVINFSNTATNASITVVANNVCGSSIVRALAYVVTTAIPGQPVTINGSLYGLCNQTNVAYNCPVVANATSYLWAVPAGVTILTGQGTNAITVKYSSTFTNTGTLSVAAVNGCGNSLAQSKTVNAKPQQPVISGLNWACKGQPGLNYSVAPVAGATSYTWSIVAGSTLVSGQGTTAIVVNWGQINGVIKCKANNACGSSSLPGQLSVSFTCKEAGTMEDFSELNIYPNPATISAEIQFDGFAEGKGRLEVYDLIGQQVLRKDLAIVTGNNQYKLDLSNFAKGAYTVKVIYNGLTRNSKLIVQ